MSWDICIIIINHFIIINTNSKSNTLATKNWGDFARNFYGNFCKYYYL